MAEGWMAESALILVFKAHRRLKTVETAAGAAKMLSLITELLNLSWNIFSCSVKTTLIQQRLNSLSFLKYFASFKRYSHMSDKQGNLTELEPLILFQSLILTS